MSERNNRSDAWADSENTSTESEPFRPLTREEAQVLMARGQGVSPWWVLTAQAAVGLVVATLAGLVTGQGAAFWSALYGAGVVVLPGALMARGMTSKLSSASPAVSAVSFMGWEFVKIGVSVALLMLAYRIVVPLSWPALLAGLVVCIKVYWVALLWRRPAKNN